MQIDKPCPTCGTRHKVEITHEWKVVEGRKVLELLLTSQSAKVDDAKLEWLSPFADDGQALVASSHRVDVGTVLLKVERLPIPGATAKPGEVANVVQPGAPFKPPEARTKSRADLLTEAAECSMKTNDAWSDAQLATALAKHKAKMQPAGA
jgi:hypothetical protein